MNMSTHVSATYDSKQPLKADLRTAETLKPEETSQTDTTRLAG